MKIMKAKIISCSSPDYWYKDLVGECVYVLKCKLDRDCCSFEKPFLYKMLITDIKICNKVTSTGNLFHKDDLQILEEFDGKLVKHICFEIVRKTNETTQS